MAKIAFTAGRVSGFKCPPDKKQAFMWDVTAPGLGLRATPAGKPAYVFQSKYQGKDIRLTIGSPAAWSIPDAQAKARELQRLIDEGKDPRDLKRDALAAQAEKQAAAAAKVQADKVAAVTVGEAWAAYIAELTPHWGDLHRKDHERLTCPAGKQQAFMRDSEAPGLRVRVTAAGAKSFVYEAKLNRQTMRAIVLSARNHPSLLLCPVPRVLSWSWQGSRWAALAHIPAVLRTSSKRLSGSAMPAGQTLGGSVPRVRPMPR